MARNEDSSLELRHVFVSAKTGGGKSQCMRNVVIPRQGIRGVFWDVDKDHYCTRYTDKIAFMKALNSAAKSKKPFRIGWAGEDDHETFVWFVDKVWKILDGDFDTWIILEEMADLEMGQRPLPGLGKLQKRARKYGGILVSNSQRVQEIPKSLITQSREIYIGQQEAHDAKYLERIIGISARELEALQPLEFFKKKDGVWTKTKIKYKPYGGKSRKRNNFS